MLASRGFAALALPYFAYEDLPKVPKQMELEYFEDALHYVMGQDNVIPDRCAMISLSRSTDIAMRLLRIVPQLTALTCISMVSCKE